MSHKHLQQIKSVRTSCFRQSNYKRYLAPSPLITRDQMCHRAISIQFNMILPLLLLLIANIASAFENIVLNVVQQDGKHERIYMEDDQNLTKYMAIDIVNQRLHELQMGSFVDLPDLRFLELKHNMIREIEPGAFRNLPSLMLINVARNHLRRIENGTFNGLPMRGLILTRNQIEDIEDGALDDLPNLVLLDLSHNRLTTISSEWFKNCPKLLDINMEDNHITQVAEMVFKNLIIDESQYYYSNRYPTINLSNNRITTLLPNAFSGLEEIFMLRLDKNQLNHIHPTAFEDIYKIHHLNFSVNQIQCVDDAVCADLKRTTVLEVTSNPLTIKCKNTLENWAKNNFVQIKT